MRILPLHYFINLNNIIMKKILFLMCAYSFMLMSCNQYEELNERALNSSKQLKDITTIIQKYGLDISTLMDMKDYYLVEDDIMFMKNDLKEYLNFATTRQGAESLQFLLSRETASNIEIEIHPEVTGEYRRAVKDAMNAWNNIPDCCIYFYEVPYYGPNRPVTTKSTLILYDRNMIIDGRTTTPSNPNKTADKVYINPSLPYLDMLETVAHELGHVLGFLHTFLPDAQHAMLVPGTDRVDDTSLMGHGRIYPSDPLFSKNDIIAAKHLFPEKPLELIIHSRDNSPYGYKYNIEAKNLISELNYKWVVTGANIGMEKRDALVIKPTNYYATVTVKLYAKEVSDQNLVKTLSFIPSQVNVPVQNW